MSRPAFVITAVHKENKKRFEVGVLWESKFAGSYNLRAQEDKVGGAYPKLPLKDVLNGDYWLNVNANRERDASGDDDDPEDF